MYCIDMLIHPSKPINDGNNDEKMLIHLDSPIKNINIQFTDLVLGSRSVGFTSATFSGQRMAKRIEKNLMDLRPKLRTVINP